MSISKGLDLLKNGSDKELLVNRFSVQQAIMYLRFFKFLKGGLIFTLPLIWFMYEYIPFAEAPLIEYILMLFSIVLCSIGLWLLSVVGHVVFYIFIPDTGIRDFILNHAYNYRNFNK